MPRLAIVISAVGTAESLEATLLTVLENRPDDCEVVAVTNFPYADPYQLAGEVRFVVQPAEADLVACVAAAIPLVRSPVVHLIAAGCEVTEGWADRALEHFADLSVGAVAPLGAAGRLPRSGARGGHSIIVPAGARRLRSAKLERIEASRIGRGVWRLRRRPRFSAAPPWRPSAVGPPRWVCELADVEMAWALHRAGYRTAGGTGRASLFRAAARPSDSAPFGRDFMPSVSFGAMRRPSVGWAHCWPTPGWLAGRR